MGRVAATVAALGNGTQSGEIGYIRVTTDAETHTVRLVWDGANDKWVGHGVVGILGFDTGLVHETDTQGDWSYWGTGADDMAKWTLRAGAIPHAGALYDAGLKLQDRMWARMQDNGGGAITYLSPWFYEFDDSDPIVFTNDTSAQSGKTWNGHADLGFEPSDENIGHGAVVQTDGSGTFMICAEGHYEDNITGSGYSGLTRNAGWDYIKFFTATQASGSVLGGTPSSTVTTPSKKFLYPTLYGYGTTGTSRSASVCWEYRWTT